MGLCVLSLTGVVAQLKNQSASWTHHDSTTRPAGEKKSKYEGLHFSSSQPGHFISLSATKSNFTFEDMEEGKDISEINNGHSDILPSIKSRSSLSSDDILWTMPIPVVLDESLGLNAVGVILQAFEQFRLKSCIDFKPRDQERDYVIVQKLDGCYSYVGLVGGPQELSIGTNCDEISLVEHEFLHALGFFHEHTRFDRDDYVTIHLENILADNKNNFEKIPLSVSTDMGVPYDYWSVMHYGKKAFSNGDGNTITTKDAKFIDIIGQTQDMSPSDTLELNRRYNCTSTATFSMHCTFSQGEMCKMKKCSLGNIEWKMVTHANNGPSSDHTSLPTGSYNHSSDDSHFMYANTAYGMEGDSATLETDRMYSKGKCNVQCLQFYYYHRGSQNDTLNIWIREFHDERDHRGSRRLMGQISGQHTSHWQVHHVPLNATTDFQVEFEVRKGGGFSSGGFSIDDVNLSETGCPHVTLQLNNIEKLLNASDSETIFSPRQYSKDGYAYRFAVVLSVSYIGLGVQLVSGKYDNQLQWPSLHKQVTLQMVDQTPNPRMQMSMRRSFTSDPVTDTSEGSRWYENPREVGEQYVDKNNETSYGGLVYGRSSFADLDTMKTRDFIKGGNAVFTLSFHDLSSLVTGDELPCPHMAAVNYNQSHDLDHGTCSSRIPTTVQPSPTTTGDWIMTTVQPPPVTTDDSIFGFSPAIVASPVLTFLLALILMIP
ncbi:meprin A subunit beta-like isoform X3 [Cynoglossus semilaevis]|uniref:meprin A subunit beta-like isoform X3 n=1 Tax=Cynoglossus semilaevis TaxID=244447 RepID=UPI000D6285A5|nr:meprin A subunit beta-like isoform X3 [Cynoglossus semilaevis]